MIRSCIIDLKGNWDKNSSLVEFADNNSYHSSISMSPYETFHGRRSISLIGWFEVGESSLSGPNLIQNILEKVQIRRIRMQKTYCRQ